MMKNVLCLFMIAGLMISCCSVEKKAHTFLLRFSSTESYFTGPSLDRYYAEMERFFSRADADMWSQYAFQDSLFATGDYFPDLERRYDRDALPEGYLQHRIDDALAQWRSSPFARELDFAGFCEYLLPYRIGTEEPEEWWTDYRATFGSVLDTLVARPGVTLAEFCDAVGRLLPEPHRSYTGYPAGKPSGKASSLKRILGGTCEDYLGLTTYLCRSYGIPIATDYTPQWGNHSKGHQWSAIIQGDSTYHFMIGEPLFLAREKPFTFRLSKAYRRMNAPQRRYPGRGSRPEDLPAPLRNPRVIDVTRYYTDVADLAFSGLREGGRFELADNAEFRNAYTIAVPDTVGMNYQTARIGDGRRYRYMRYIPAAGTSGNIAEIELYDRSGKLLPAGKVIGTYRAADRFHPMENVFDGDVLSYASCSPTQREAAWVGVDLGRAVELSALSYLPRNDDNFIREGEEYELCYWDGVGWASLGRQIGRRATQEQVYDNVPAGALLLLHNHTKGKEERIFTYEDGRQVWW